jgi:hypothetical protein
MGCILYSSCYRMFETCLVQLLPAAAAAAAACKCQPCCRSHETAPCCAAQWAAQKHSADLLQHFAGPHAAVVACSLLRLSRPMPDPAAVCGPLLAGTHHGATLGANLLLGSGLGCCGSGISLCAHHQPGGALGPGCKHTSIPYLALFPSRTTITVMRSHMSLCWATHRCRQRC